MICILLDSLEAKSEGEATVGRDRGKLLFYSFSVPRSNLECCFLGQSTPFVCLSCKGGGPHAFRVSNDRHPDPWDNGKPTDAHGQASVIRQTPDFIAKHRHIWPIRFSAAVTLHIG